MQPRHRVSTAALELIKRFEGLRRKAARTPDGRWTIGYGHTASAREGTEIGADDAEALLLYDLRSVSRAVNEWTYAPLTQNQFDALIAFAFNVGLPAFRGSNVLRRVNEGNLVQAATALDAWRRAEFEGEPQVIDALIRRRAAEKALFLTPPGVQPAAPTPVLPPQMDWGVGVLEAQPLELIAPLDGDPAPTLAPPAETPAPPSRAAQAADAAAERLQQLFPAAIPPAPARPPAEERPPFPAEPPPPEAVAPRALAEDPAADPARQLAPPAPASSPPDLAPTPEPAEPDAREERWPYVLLFIGGAVLFVAGISASMRAEGLSWLGVGLASLGIAAIGVSVYFLLKRIEAGS